MPLVTLTFKGIGLKDAAFSRLSPVTVKFTPVFLPGVNGTLSALMAKGSPLKLNLRSGVIGTSTSFWKLEMRGRAKLRSVTLSTLCLNLSSSVIEEFVRLMLPIENCSGLSSFLSSLSSLSSSGEEGISWMRVMISLKLKVSSPVLIMVLLSSSTVMY